LQYQVNTILNVSTLMMNGWILNQVFLFD
jgi:hypothetical protein